MCKNILRDIAYTAAAMALFFKLDMADASVITFDHVAMSGAVGSEFTINIIGDGFVAGEDATDPYGYPTVSVAGSSGGGLSLNWDASVLHLVGVDRTMLNYLDIVGYGDDYLGETGVIDNTTGTLSDLSVSSMWGNPGTKFGVAELRFAIVGQGSSPLTLSLSDLDVWADFEGNLIHPSVVNGTITVSGVPLPSAVVLFGCSLLGLLAYSRRKAVAV